MVPWPTWFFSHSEVDTLTMQRAPADQLEVIPSGLLRHHHCYQGWPTLPAELRHRPRSAARDSYRHFKQWIAEYGLYMHI